MTRGPRTDPTAVVARRGGAWFIDTVLCGLAAAVPALLLADAYSFDRAANGLDLEATDGDVALFVRDTVIVLSTSEMAVTLGALAVAVLLLLVLLPGRRGWSPGYLAADLRLVRRDGSRAGVGRALLRTLAWLVDGLPGLPLVAWLSTRLTRRHQRVGDVLARTFVVDKRADGRPVDRPLETDDALAVEREPEPEAGPEPAEPAPQPKPEPEPARRPEPVTAGGPPPGVPADQPIWDRRHRRYVLWHGKSQRWLAHGDEGWAPIEATEEAGATPDGGPGRQDG